MGTSLRILDKEFQQIACEAEQGKRYADQLVKVWQTQGEELWLLVHVEIQAQKEDNFSKRMFTYNFCIFDRFDQPATSLAILCDPNRQWRPSNYSYNYPNTRLIFEFGSIKLLDYENRFHELDKRINQLKIYFYEICKKYIYSLTQYRIFWTQFDEFVYFNESKVTSY